MPVGQVAVIGLGDQPGHDLIQCRFGGQRFTEPAVEPLVIQGPGGGVDQITQARRMPAKVRPKASSMPTVGGGPCVVLMEPT